MTELHKLQPGDPPQDKAANDYHDRRYGWHVSCAREYTNIARNPEYVAAVPQSWLDDCKDAVQVHKKFWEWHNRAKETVLQLVQSNRNESSPPLFSKA